METEIINIVEIIKKNKQMREVKSFIDLMKSFYDEKSCREFLEDIKWRGEPICPHCNCQTKEHYKLKSNGEFKGLYKCKRCKKRFTVTIGTVFEGSHVPLKKWFYALYIFLAHKKGISSIQLSKDIDVTQKTAWFMLERIRHNLKDKLVVQFNDMTQVDETYVGGKNKGRVKNAQGRSLKVKTPVVGLLSNGMAYTAVVPNTGGKVLKTIINTLVKEGSTVITDGWKGYTGISKNYIHKVVEHSTGEYVKDGFHTNSIEGFWSHLKRGILGIYHKVSPKHLDKYCDEFAFRYNTRGLTDVERFTYFTMSAYKRLKYQSLISP